jgi:hypothetical protein
MVGSGSVPARVVKIIARPRRTAREILADPGSLRGATAFVLAYAVAVSVLFLSSHLAGDYPPPPEELATWTGTWGEFAMLPFVEIAPERYRLAQAIFFTPLVLATWMLMAGSARLISAFWRGRIGYTQYLSLFGFSFFVFWALASGLDLCYSLAMGDLVVPVLRGEHGPMARALAAGFPPVVWTLLLGLGAVYNGIVTYEGEGFSVPRTMLVSAVTVFWPFSLITFLIR